MSGDVQPRKRKDKRKKKDEEEILQRHGSVGGGSDEVIHIHKESKLGGNICSKIVFFCLLGALGCMIGLIIIEYHGTGDMEIQSAADSPWSVMLEGWVDEPGKGNDGHDHEEEHLSHEEDNSEHDEQGKHEGEHSDVEHEEEVEQIEDERFENKTYEDLREAYNQITPDESEVDATRDSDLKGEEYGTESEPELSEGEEEEEEEVEEGEEDEVQKDNPQWESESGPDLLAEELEEVQSDLETEEESSEELSSDTKDGAQSIEEKETYGFADITNRADWEIKDKLDEADRVLDDGDFPT